jgi:hypothetical protein
MYYTYLWLREDGTPYYVGKGTGDRAFVRYNHRHYPPKDKSLILLQEHISEQDALEAEKFLITFYGRVDLGTGCLRNLTDGGDNPPSRKGKTMPEEAKQRIRAALKGRKRPESFRLKMLGKQNNLGYRHTAEAKKRIGEASLGNTYATRRGTNG